MKNYKTQVFLTKYLPWYLLSVVKLTDNYKYLQVVKLTDNYKYLQVLRLADNYK